MRLDRVCAQRCRPSLRDFVRTSQKAPISLYTGETARARQIDRPQWILNRQIREVPFFQGGGRYQGNPRSLSERLDK